MSPVVAPPALVPAAPAPVTPTPAAVTPDREWGWCVRLEWYDGSHDLVGWCPTEQKAAKKAARTRRYWRGGPCYLARCAVVPISRAAAAAHPRAGCRRPDCPR